MKVMMLQEVLVNLVGAILMITAGSIAISYHSPRYDRNYQDSQVGVILRGRAWR